MVRLPNASSKYKILWYVSWFVPKLKIHHCSFTCAIWTPWQLQSFRTYRTEDSFFLHHILDLPPLTTSTESATGGTSTSLTPLKICWLNFKFQSGQFGGTAFAVAHRKVTLLNLHQPNFFGAYDKPICVVVSMSAYF